MWDAIVNFIVNIIGFIAGFVGDWGLAIIVFTVIVRLLLSPLTSKSTRSSVRMSAMQPRMQEIQEKYADDPERMQEEMRKLQSEEGFNPLGGCLPLLIQFPIFMALYQGLLHSIPGDAMFFGLLHLSTSPASSLGDPGLPMALAYIAFDVLFGILTFVPMIINQQPGTDVNQRRQSMMMGGFMAVFMLFIGWNLGIGVLLYYIVSSLWGVVQNRLVTTSEKKRIEEAHKEDEAITKQIDVDIVRKERKPRPRKKN